MHNRNQAQFGERSVRTGRGKTRCNGCDMCARFCPTGTLNHGNDNIVYDRELRKFPKDETFSQLKSAIDAGDVTAAAPLAHTFQHPCATLAFSQMYVDMQPVVEALDAEELPAAEELEAVEISYRDIADFLASC